MTDPPYGLKFMGKKWDYDVPSVEVWRECLRVLKPGGHALIACGTRTQHRMAVNIEDAGFEIRDVVTWLYGSGFPKSLDVSKAIDKAVGAERKVIGQKDRPGGFNRGVLANSNFGRAHQDDSGAITEPASQLAKQWSGWGTALKPACEFWTLARKPLDGTVAANVLKHGVGGINVDATRIHPGDEVLERPPLSTNKAEGWKRPWNDDLEARSRAEETKRIAADKAQQLGRWPANLILDEEAAAMLDEQSGTLTSGSRAAGVRKGMGFHGADGDGGPAIIGNSGGASRFFYVAKASKSERNAGLEHLPTRRGGSEQFDFRWKEGVGEDRMPMNQNHHPTVKPVKLMRYLCRLITPPRGLVLDPFMGSGSTGVAAKAEGFEFVGIEREKEYFEIAQARMSK